MQETFALTSDDAKRMDIDECLETEAWYDGTIRIVQTGGGRNSQDSNEKNAALVNSH